MGWGVVAAKFDWSNGHKEKNVSASLVATPHNGEAGTIF
ncbi:hypothetical protein THTE_1079 [Thermogutta terrifontis]|uniref:Uncharacterized protein n=1 Tax=Thermogutta terrifontis TaxID=1331910 RepID=A0A286RCJ6_9BACT|nr:hypothetical protein THTE_1079 [Thermogutta terrifontis]